MLVLRPGSGGHTRPMPKVTNSLSDASKVMQANLRLWRKSRKLTLSQLAEASGFAVSTLSGWENGDREVGMEDLRRLAAVYDVHPAALLLNPEEAGPIVARMIKASGLAQRMGEQAADQWLAVGETMAGKRPE